MAHIAMSVEVMVTHFNQASLHFLDWTKSVLDDYKSLLPKWVARRREKVFKTCVCLYGNKYLFVWSKLRQMGATKPLFLF